MVNLTEAGGLTSAIEMAREAKGISLLQLAEQTGIAYTTLHRKMHKAPGSFKVAELALIALELDVTLQTLLKKLAV